MVDIIAGAVVLSCVSLSSMYMYKEKKNGSKCIGCPLSKTCGKCSSKK